MRSKQKGFSLIELLIVVAIILIIAAIAIPNLLRSRMAANQASAVGSLRTMDTAAITYNSTWGNGFPASITAIGTTPGTTTVTCTNAELIDSVLTSGQKSGYNFVLIPGAIPVTAASSSCGTLGYADGFEVTAMPVSPGTTGQNSYCDDASGVIRVDPNGASTAGTAPNCLATDNPL